MRDGAPACPLEAVAGASASVTGRGGRTGAGIGRVDAPREAGSAAGRVLAEAWADGRVSAEVSVAGQAWVAGSADDRVLAVVLVAAGRVSVEVWAVGRVLAEVLAARRPVQDLERDPRQGLETDRQRDPRQDLRDGRQHGRCTDQAMAALGLVAFTVAGAATAEAFMVAVAAFMEGDMEAFAAAVEAASAEGGEADGAPTCGSSMTLSCLAISITALDSIASSTMGVKRPMLE